MSKMVCDICGNEFVWQKGMAYCSYDCEKKARQKRDQEAQKRLEKIEKDTQCPACGFIGVHIERWNNDDHGLCWETFYKCRKCGRKTKDTQWFVYKKPTVFDRITASPEVLAAEMVFWGHDKDGEWYTSHLLDEDYRTEAEATAATVAKLKEVCNGND